MHSILFRFPCLIFSDDLWKSRISTKHLDRTPPPLQQNSFFFEIFHTGKREQFIFYFTYQWMEKNLITKLLLFSFSVRFNRRPYITDRKNGQCLFSTGYIPPHVFCPSCPDLVWGKMFGELQQDFDKCEEHVLMASCQSKKLCLNKPFVMKPFPDRQICCLLQIRRKWITSPNETQAHVATDKW